MKKKDVTILAIGDKADYDSYKKFHKDRGLFLKKGFDYANCSYRQVSAGKMPKIPTEKVVIFLFFPFYHWNRHIENRHYRGIYGNLRFYSKFKAFNLRLRSSIKKSLAGKKIFFINDPLRCAIYRDKLLVKKSLGSARIPHPRLYRAASVKNIKKRLEKGLSFFLKPRCGSMGKGITFLSRRSWQTNFLFKGGKIISRKSDKGWKFRDVTGNTGFLKRLLMKDIFVEEAIDMPVLNRMKVDLRVYTFFNKALYLYPRKNKADRVTTNITQGGKGDPSLLDILPKTTLYKAKKLAEETSGALGFNLGGVDLVMHRNLEDIYVVDVNAFPGFPKRRTFKITPPMVDELAKQLNKGKLHFETP